MVTPEINSNDIKRLEERVSKLEHQREQDKKEFHSLDKSLTIFTNEIKNVSEDLKNVVSNFKEAIQNSTNAQEKEINNLKERVELLDKKLQEETIGSDAKKWKEFTKYILFAIIGAIVSLVLSKIGLGG